MTVTVVHVNNVDGWDLYIGRAEPRAKNKLAHVQSPWANSYRVSVFGIAGALQRYHHDIVDRLTHEEIYPALNESFADQLRALDGLRLACWCAGVDEILTVSDEHVCHGQILAMHVGRLCAR